MVYSTIAGGFFSALSLSKSWNLSEASLFHLHINAGIDHGYAREQFHGENHYQVSALFNHFIIPQFGFNISASYSLAGNGVKADGLGNESFFPSRIKLPLRISPSSQRLHTKSRASVMLCVFAKNNSE